MPESLEQKLARKAYLGWTPTSDEEIHALAVIGGDKPAALFSIFEGEMEYALQLQELAQKHGCQVLIYCEPDISSQGDSGLRLNFHKNMFFYRDDTVCDDFIQLTREWYTGQTRGNEFSRRKGEILGYQPADIEAFTRNYSLADDADGSTNNGSYPAGTPGSVRSACQGSGIQRHIATPPGYRHSTGLTLSQTLHVRRLSVKVPLHPWFEELSHDRPHHYFRYHPA